MQQRSKVILIVCGVIIAYLVAVWIPLSKLSKPKFGPEDGRAMLNDIKAGIETESTSRVLRWAHPDFMLAEKNLKQTTTLLQKAFANISRPQVEFSDVRFEMKGNVAVLSCRAQVLDEGGSAAFDAPITFQVQKREVPQFLGLYRIAEWKVTKVRAPYIPDDGP